MGKVVQILSLMGIKVTAGALYQALARIAAAAKPTISSLELAVRTSTAVAADETGWRVGGHRQWLWVFVGDRVTVYLIALGRGFEQAASVLGKDFAGVLERDGWAPYRSFNAAAHQTCVAHLLRRCGELIADSVAGQARVPHAVRRFLLDALTVRNAHAELLAAGGEVIEGTCVEIAGEQLRLRDGDPGEVLVRPEVIDATAVELTSERPRRCADDDRGAEGEVPIGAEVSGATAAELARDHARTDADDDRGADGEVPADAEVTDARAAEITGEQLRLDADEDPANPEEVPTTSGDRRENLNAEITRLEGELESLLAGNPAHPPNRKLLKHLRNEREHLLTFLKRPGVEATNWRAEQAIRPAVVNRKNWGGNRTEHGAEVQQTLMSVIRTARQQEVDPIGVLADLLRQPSPAPTTMLRVPSALAEPRGP